MLNAVGEFCHDTHTSCIALEWNGILGDQKKGIVLQEQGSTRHQRKQNWGIIWPQGLLSNASQVVLKKTRTHTILHYPAMFRVYTQLLAVLTVYSCK